MRDERDPPARRKVFVSKGFHATTIADMAKKAGPAQASA
jgi:AcrR family transcriptional regulator